MMNYTKYKPYPPMDMPNRKWPNNVIKKAPIWCSVDLRDGNQSLEIPMNIDEKIEFFNFLVKIGFKEIEIGLPAINDTEFEFVRRLIDDSLIPKDVTIQVLTQSKPEIIKRTFKALEGAKKAIVHLYNPISTLERTVVFESSAEETKQLAVKGAELMLKEAVAMPETEFVFEYSPEGFTETELSYAVEVCNAVLDIWKPTKKNNVIINLPSTVEVITANMYADKIEYCCEHIKYRDNVKISLHAHNDRGTAVAATELALMAGADRVEGTLFGNGERTGNTDILNVAMNIFSRGIDPKLDFSNIDEAVEIYEKSTKMAVNPRHPYAGALVYTAFSSSHQAAIQKGMEKMQEHPDSWEVPYLPIDPRDVGRNYDPIVRISGQSGKGGVAYILEYNFGLFLPKAFQQDFSTTTSSISGSSSAELAPKEIYDAFMEKYVDIKEPVQLVKYNEISGDKKDYAEVEAVIKYYGVEIVIRGVGNGVIDAFCHAIEKKFNVNMEIIDYREHSMEYGTKARAIAYIQISNGKGGRFYGAGTSSNITKSSLRAVVSTVNKMITMEEE